MNSLKQHKVVLVVIDGFGIGSLPDAEAYGDAGANTLRTLVEAGIDLHFLPSLGLYAAAGIPWYGQVTGRYAKQVEQSAGKDTPVGHWEICGAVTRKAFPLYPEGFPQEVTRELKRLWGTDILGNVAASGTEIIQQLGDEHCRTGYPIVYTSADSVLQIAAHEGIISLDKLYQYCETARKVMAGPHEVGRIVARPFIGASGHYVRTANRLDYAVEPPLNLLDFLEAYQIPVYAVGKIANIFSGRGIYKSYHTSGNREGLDRTHSLFQSIHNGLIFTNLVDTDVLYGHRNDIVGYCRCVEEIDKSLAALAEEFTEDDLLIVTGDHGCDPGFPGTDHTREYTPALLYSPGWVEAQNCGITDTFGCIAATIADFLHIPYSLVGHVLGQEA